MVARFAPHPVWPQTTDHRRTRLVRLVCAVLLGGLVAALGTAGAAAAGTTYRYWGYFHVKHGDFAFAQTGPAGYTPHDGDTEAYRYAASAAATQLEPRADLHTLSFSTICGGTPPLPHHKRVAVIVDFGLPADADGAQVPPPRADCAQVAGDASGLQVLTAVVHARTEKGLVCGVDGYPASGCGGPADHATRRNGQPVGFTVPANDTSSDTGLLWPLVGVGLLLAVIVAALVAVERRRRLAPGLQAPDPWDDRPPPS